MIRILSEKEYRFTGYGLTIVPGVNELRERVPHGLQKSLKRHEAAGHFVVEWNVAGEPAKPPAVPPVTRPTPVAEPKREEAARPFLARQEAVETSAEPLVPSQPPASPPAPVTSPSSPAPKRRRRR
jgi:hypothetical protein